MAVDIYLRFHPGSLRKLHATKTEPPGGIHRLRGHPDHVGPVTECFEWSWPHFDPRLLIMRRISLNDTRLKAAQNDPRRLIEALARLAELHAKGIELPFRESAAESDDHPPPRQMIQKNRLLGHP